MGTQAALVGLALALSACGGDVPATEPPAASISAPQMVVERTAVLLDGSHSSDSDGSIVGYEWTVAGSDKAFVEIIDHRQKIAVLRVGEVMHRALITVQLKVTDDKGAAGTASIAIELSEIDFVDILPALNDGDSYCA